MFKAISLFLLACTLSASPVVDNATGLIFPETIGRWIQSGHREYEPKELGTSYSYKANDSSMGAITCYVYSKGLPSIPAGGASEIARNEIHEVAQGIVSAWRDRNMRVEEIMPAHAVHSADSDMILGLICAHRITEASDITNISLSFVTGYKNRILKIRYTFPGSDLNKALDGLHKFADLLVLTNEGNLPALALSPLPAIEQERHIATFYDSSLPDERSAALWLAYAVMRANHRVQAGYPPPPEQGEIKPEFIEEVEARRQTVQVYRELKQADTGFIVPYWDVMQKVEEAGFMPAYVWTFLHHSHWPESDAPDNLVAFAKWKKKKLKNHTAETRGGLSFE